jgi:3',5'-nucleoside bisphosphate phosphatase
MKADLHCHSHYSDGSCSPAELIDIAASVGFSGLAITDHDTLQSFPEAAPYAAQKGIGLIPGVELSTVCLNDSVHVLGYAFDPTDESLLRFCCVHRERREMRNQKILDNLKRYNIVISMDEVKAFSPNASTYGRPHIALVMMKNGHVATVYEAFSRYIGSGKCCYEAGEKWTSQEAIAAIHEARGKAVIAHPHLVRNNQVMQALLSMPFDGLEGYYSCASSYENHRWCKVAEGKGWFITGGSDFHGSVRPEVAFGSSWTPDKTFELLSTHFRSLGTIFTAG